MIRLPSGRLVVTIQINTKNSALAPGHPHDDWGLWRGLVYVSDDHGHTWRHVTYVPFTGLRPVTANGTLYIIGHNCEQDSDRISGVGIMRSMDNGETWSSPSMLTQDGADWIWYAQAGSEVRANGRVYFALERASKHRTEYNRGTFAPVVLSALETNDWTDPSVWTFSNDFTFNEALTRYGAPRMFGIPFYAPGDYTVSGGPIRRAGAMGWYEPNMVQLTDPNNIWYDPGGHTFHLFLRAVTSFSNIACLVKVMESPDGSTMTVDIERAPSGEPVFFIPFPGGQNRFHITWDPLTRLYWLVSLQPTDTMARIETLNPKRIGLTNNERHRLVLHFSKNCIDWCFAGMVAMGASDGESRHYGPGVIDGDDLQVLCRSAGPEAENAHNADMITFHTVSNFRDLIY